MKAMKDFWASKAFLDENANFATIAYEEGVKDARKMVIARCPRMELGFLDEPLTLEEGEVVADALVDPLAPIAIDIDASRDALAPLS